MHGWTRSVPINLHLSVVPWQVYIEKQKGEILGVVIVESGWGSILPTVIIASLLHAGPAEKSGRLNIGDQIMTVNGTSLVGLPLSTCQSIIKVHSSISKPEPMLISFVFTLHKAEIKEESNQFLPP